MTSYRFFKMPNAERGRSILLPASYLLMLLRSEGLRLSANQISSTYLNWRLRYSYCRFWKQTPAILEFYFRFPSQSLHRNLQSACYSASGYLISSKSKHPLRKYDVRPLCPFLRTCHNGPIFLGHSDPTIEVVVPTFPNHFNNNNNNNNRDNVYRADIHGRAIARVHPVHLMNVEWRQAAADPKPSQTT